MAQTIILYPKIVFLECTESKSETIPKADLTIKAIGNQWYWTYEYPDYEDIAFDANMLLENELSDPKLRLLETDTQIVVPVNKVVKLQITSADVLHAWTIPAFGVKMDAVPGIVTYYWFEPNKVGEYEVLCVEYCGVGHYAMRGGVIVQDSVDYKNWLDEQETYSDLVAKQQNNENNKKKLAKKIN